MTRRLILAALLAAASPALAQTPDLQGRWAPEDGSSVIRVSACAPGGKTLCAVIESETPTPGEPSAVGQTVLRDLAPGKDGQWRGRFVADGADYGATVKFVSPQTVEFKVCVVALFCQTEKYQRLPS